MSEWTFITKVLEAAGFDAKSFDGCDEQAVIALIRNKIEWYEDHKAKLGSHLTTASAERDRLQSALADIRVTAREQCQKTGAPVAHALDFILALDRILNDAAEALDGGATT